MFIKAFGHGQRNFHCRPYDLGWRQHGLLRGIESTLHAVDQTYRQHDAVFMTAADPNPT